MPVLRYRNMEGKLERVLLSHTAGHDGKTPPLTFGPAEDAHTHIHIADANHGGTSAQIIGSDAGVAYAYVLKGENVLCNNRSLNMIRVLRHGDCFRLGATELTYLDFAIEKLGPESALVRRACALPSCFEAPAKFAAGEDCVTCPWCDRAYHALCWLQSEQCVHLGCYPIRRMLLSEMKQEIKLEEMSGTGTVKSRICVARCSMTGPAPTFAKTIRPPIGVGEDIIRCPNKECQAPFHPGCWFSWRGKCPQCDSYDIGRTIDRLLFRAAVRNQK